MLKTTKRPKSPFILRILKANILSPSTHTIVFSKRRYYQKPPDNIVNYVVEQDHENQPNTTVTVSSQVSDDHVDSSEHREASFSSLVYHVADRVDGFYQGFRGPQMFFPDHITVVHSDGTYDIEYDDGDKETRVAAGFIRYLEDADKDEDSSGVNEDHVTSSVSVETCDEFELARIVRAKMT